VEIERREMLGMAALAAVLLPADPPALAKPVRRNTKLSATLHSIAAGVVRDRQTAGFGIGFRQSGGQAEIFSIGKANLETGTPVSAETVFRIGSLTKQFTAAAIVQLSESRRLSLDDRIDQFFLGFGAFSSGAVPTVRQLLTHTAGLHDYVFGGLPSDAGTKWQRSPDRWRLISRMQPLYDFEPGTFWSYSNSNYVLLGSIIERVAGEAYIDFTTREVLKRAGLTKTAFDSYADVVPHRASGYSLADNSAGAFRNAENSGLPLAEGGLRSTVTDMLRWNDALFGGRVVSAAGLKLMTTAATTSNGTPVGSAHFTPKGLKPNPPPAFVQQADYGFGLEVARIFNTPVIWHSGGIPGFTSILLHFTELRTDLVLLTNTDNGAVPAFEPAIRAVTGNSRETGI
jgi:CubicO group peptidase (beta-lactamase class C family)